MLSSLKKKKKNNQFPKGKIVYTLVSQRRENMHALLNMAVAFPAPPRTGRLGLRSVLWLWDSQALEGAITDEEQMTLV